MHMNLNPMTAQRARGARLKSRRPGRPRAAGRAAGVACAGARARSGRADRKKIVLKNSSDPTLTCLYRLDYRVKKKEKKAHFGRRPHLGPKQCFGAQIP